MSCRNCTCRKCQRQRNAANAQHCRDRYYRLRARGLCVRCGDATAQDGRVMCGECLWIHKVKANARAGQPCTEYASEQRRARREVA